MNKISILGLSAFMAMGFASCDGYEEPNPKPQTNEQESIVKPDEVTFSNTIASTDVVDLAAYNNEEKNITVATVAGVLPEGYEFETKAEFSVNGADWFAVPTTVVPVEAAEAAEAAPVYNVTINPDEFDGIYCQDVTRDPAKVKVDMRYKLYTRTGGMVGLIRTTEGAEYRTASFDLKPMGPGHVIEEKYYLVKKGAPMSEAVELTRDLSAGDNVYDNPVFSGVLEIAGDIEWAVIPESTFAAGSLSEAPYAVWGVDAENVEAASGALVPALEGAPYVWGKFSGKAAYKVTVNMYEKTYAFEMALANIYCIGSHCKNNPKNATIMGTVDYSSYWAYVNLGNAFRFISQPTSKPDMQWGKPDEGEAGTMELGKGVAFNPEKQGFSFVEANIVKLTYKTTFVESIGLIGDATPGGWDEDTDLTQTSNPYIWEGEITLAATGEFKFRANDGWDVNLGCEKGSATPLGNLIPGGDNIPTLGAGTYNVRLDLSTIPMTAVFTAK